MGEIYKILQSEKEGMRIYATRSRILFPPTMEALSLFFLPSSFSSLFFWVHPTFSLFFNNSPIYILFFLPEGMEGVGIYGRGGRENGDVRYGGVADRDLISLFSRG